MCSGHVTLLAANELTEDRLQVKVNFKSSGISAAHTMGDLLTITEVARRSGVASSALRFYESRGLIASESPLSARRPPPYRLHCLCAEDRSVTRGNRR
jgi:hypothetical protein